MAKRKYSNFMQIGSTLNEWLDVIQFMNFGKGYGNFKSYGKFKIRIDSDVE